MRIIRDNQAFYRELFRTHMDSPVTLRFVEQSIQASRDVVARTRKMGDAEFDVASRYMLFGMLGVPREWVEGGCTQDPGELSSILADLTERLFAGSLGSRSTTSLTRERLYLAGVLLGP